MRARCHISLPAATLSVDMVASRYTKVCPGRQIDWSPNIGLTLGIIIDERDVIRSVQLEGDLAVLRPSLKPE